LTDDPEEQGGVQKFRSPIHTSPGRTVARISSVIDRSWAWPSWQGMASTTNIRCGSRITRLPWQGAGALDAERFEAVLGAWQVAAIGDADAVAGEPRLPLPTHRLDGGGHCGRGVADQHRAEWWFHAVDLVADGLAGHAEDLGMLLGGGVS
jgi:hypothetical protein